MRECVKNLNLSKNLNFCVFGSQTQKVYESVQCLKSKLIWISDIYYIYLCDIMNVWPFTCNSSCNSGSNENLSKGISNSSFSSSKYSTARLKHFIKTSFCCWRFFCLNDHLQYKYVIYSECLKSKLCRNPNRRGLGIQTVKISDIWTLGTMYSQRPKTERPKSE